MVTGWIGAPRKAARLCGERRSSGMSERWLFDAKHKKVVASDMQLATTLAEGVGFEPTWGCPQTDFESAPL